MRHANAIYISVELDFFLNAILFDVFIFFFFFFFLFFVVVFFLQSVLQFFRSFALHPFHTSINCNIV